MTIQEIAEKAGVSLATVSRVINNYPYVNKVTRAKVLKVLSDNNFVPNETARSLATNTSKMIGILIADIRTTHHTEAVYYIEHEFNKNGYSCLIYDTGTNPEDQKRYIQILSQRKVEAAVLIGSVYQNTTVQNAIMVYLPNTPVAICNGYLDGPNIYGVIADELDGVRDAVRVLSERGKRNFRFINSQNTPSAQAKIRGFEDGCRLYADGHGSVLQCGDTPKDIMQATKDAMSVSPRPDVLIFAEDYLAFVGMHALVEERINVSSDVAVVGINNSRYGEISNPALTSIDNMLFDVCTMCARNLINVLSGERVNHKMIITCEFVERATT